MSYLTRAYSAAKLALQANGPTLMVVGGVASMTAGAVIGAKNTLHVEEVLSKHTPDLEKIEKGQALQLEGYSPEMARADRIKVYTRASLDLSKLYAVPGVLFVGGAAMVFGGHRMMVQRNATLAIAFTAVSEAFEKYRARVVHNNGDEYDQAMMSGYVRKTVGDPETGEDTVIHTRDWENNPNDDPYNRVFEQGASSMWQPDLGVNKMFIAMQQKFAQERLGRQDHLYLSDVYEALGFPESPLSRVVGWKVTRNPDGSKNIPRVDFGLDKPHPDDWKYSAEKAIYLDFNCHGLIVGGKLQKLLEQA